MFYFNEKNKGILKLVFGLIVITFIIDIPHNLFGLDWLSLLSIFSFLLIGLGCFFTHRFYLLLLTVICSLIPLFCLPYFWANMELGRTLWRVILSTNSNELIEQLNQKFIYFIIISLPITWLLSYKGIGALFSINITKKIFRLMGIIGVIGLSISVLIGSKSYEGNLYLSLRSLQPIVYPVSFLSELKYRLDHKHFIIQHANFHFAIKQKDSFKDKHLIVLVIGETARYDHWSLNGYYRKTTPRLEEEKNVFNFGIVSAPAGGTIYSIPLIMTSVDPYDYNVHYKNKGIIDAFNEGKYYTCYISNQPETRSSYLKDEYHYQDVDTFINTESIKGERDMKDNYYDESIFPIINKLLPQIEQHKNVFICIHLLGNHNDYTKRYRAQYDRWNKDSYVKYKNKYNYDKEIAQYDNSVLYSDYILDSLIHILRKVPRNTSMIFVSDHGENLKDDSLKLIGHSPQPNKYLMHIPYFVWLGDSSLKYHPDWPFLLQKHKNIPLLSSECTLFTLLDLGELQSENFKQKQKEYSLLSNELIPSSQHVFAPNFKKLTYPDLLK